MDQLLQHIKEVLEEIQDTHENLETLEKLFESFAKVQHTALKERTTLRAQLSRAEAEAGGLRLRLIDIEIIGRQCLKMWLTNLVATCTEMSIDGWKVLLKARELEWIDHEDMPPPPPHPPAHVASDIPKPESEKD